MRSRTQPLSQDGLTKLIAELMTATSLLKKEIEREKEQQLGPVATGLYMAQADIELQLAATLHADLSEIAPLVEELFAARGLINDPEGARYFDQIIRRFLPGLGDYYVQLLLAAVMAAPAS